MMIKKTPTNEHFPCHIQPLNNPNPKPKTLVKLKPTFFIVYWVQMRYNEPT